MNGYVISVGMIGLAVGAVILGTQKGPEPAGEGVRAATSPRRETIDAVKNLKIFFGHQSVGVNILDGVRELAPDIRIERIATVPEAPMIAEAAIGRNGSTTSKLNDFSEKLQALGNNVDVAMMKFCYVDFEAATNVGNVQRQYAETLAALSSKYPKTRFVHVTVPLTVTQSGPKAIVKRLMGKSIAGEFENRNRSEFNDWLRKTYSSSELFDLAAVESRTPEGEAVSFELEGRSYPMLYAGYSDDGSHLAGVGRRVAAVAFLDALQRVTQSPR